jgi:hypothetical protein
MGGACSTYGDEERCIQKPEEKRRRWENNVKKNIQEVGWAEWTGLIWLKIGTSCRLL